MRMEKRKELEKKSFIWVLIILTLLTATAAIIVFKNKEWFLETVPYYSEMEESGFRSEENVFAETYSTGEKRYREGDFVSGGGTWFCLREGVSMDMQMNVTIKKGSFKVAVYDLGKNFDIDGKLPSQYLSEDIKVYEEEYTETGMYQMDLSMVKPDETYMIVYLEPLGGEAAYSYRSTEKLYVKRWQYLYDAYIGSLPFLKTKYGGNVN